MVLFSHQFAVTGRAEPSILGVSYGTMGVLIFFCISGYLVAQSWERNPHIVPFWAKRVLRIWPGLIVVTAVSAFVLGPCLTSLPLPDYFSSSGTFKFFYHLKLSGAHNELPGVFTGNPLPKAVNGSLWTIPIEVDWYLVLFLLGMLGILRRRYLVLLLSAALAAYYFSGLANDSKGLPRAHITFGLFFLIGVCLHYFQDIWRRRQRQAAIFALCAAAALGYSGYATASLAASLPFFVVAFGDASTPVIRRFGRYGDFSYGIYIYAFPAQQTIVLLSGDQLTLMQSLVASAASTLALAFLSWHFVEAPALRLKERFAAKPPPRVQVAEVR